MPAPRPSIPLAALATLALLVPLLAAPPGARASQPLVAPLTDGIDLGLPAVDPAVPSPADSLGYPLGARFTRYADILDYLEALDAASDRVAMWEYGETYEGRPLVLLAVSAAGNVARLDEVRREHLAAVEVPGTGPAAGGPRAPEAERFADSPLVVWLAYGVHGNESSSAEAAMAAAYLLAAGRTPDGTPAFPLEETVVLIDPLSNPDGRERFVASFEQRRGRLPDLHSAAAEHHEPWPGGRFNHYLFDLNRDWAWLSQRETRDRIAAFRRWEPQVYVDFHEMSAASTYFFPPAADPVHPQIDPRVVAWLDVFGRGNAAAFDERGILFYKAESFDLFYPGYGDSYPALSGAVGMTYEMAGGGFAGQAVELPDGRILTLADRVARHLLTSLSTVETAVGNHDRLLADFVATRAENSRGPGATYLWRDDQPEARSMAALLAGHGVEVARLGAAAEAEVEQLGRPDAAAGRGGPSERLRRFPAGTFVASTAQPLGDLLAVLMELDAPMSEAFLARQRERVERELDPEFYDVTAWALPLAFGVEAWRAEGPVAGARSPAGLDGAAGGIRGSGSVGYLIPPQGVAQYRAAAALLGTGIRLRLALDAFEAGGERFPAGTLFVPRLGNPEDLEAFLAEIAAGDAGIADAGLDVVRAGTSYTGAGISLGSDRVLPVRPPRVGLFSGEGVSPTSFGSLWHLLDREIELAHSRIDVARLDRVDLGEFDVLVLPDGSGWEEALGEEGIGSLERWVGEGGTLVAIAGAAEALAASEAFGGGSEEAAEGDGEEADGEEETPPFYTPGAAVATGMTPGHPLVVGYGEPPVVLVRGRRVLATSGRPQRDVLTVAESEPVVGGFAWPEAEEELAGSLLAGVEERGRGRVVTFAHDPAFRGFWRSTMPMLLNAVLYGPSWE